MKNFISLATTLLALFLLNVAASAITFDDHDWAIKLTIHGDNSLWTGDFIKQENESWGMRTTYSDGTVQEAWPHNNMLVALLGAEFFMGNFAFEADFQYFLDLEVLSTGGGRYESKSYTGMLMSAYGAMAGLIYYFATFSKGSIGGGVFIGPRVGVLIGTLYPYASYTAYSGHDFGTVTVSGFNVSPTVGYEFLFGNLMLGISSSYFHNFLFTDRSLSTVYYQNLDNFINFGFVTFDLNIGWAF